MTNLVRHDRKMLEALVCPLTQAALQYNEEKQELISKTAGLPNLLKMGFQSWLPEEARLLN